MAKAIEYEDWSEKVSRTWSCFTEFGVGNNLSGIVNTPLGYVDVTIWGCRDKNPGATHLSFIHKGRKYNRNYKKSLSERGAVTKAVRFAKEIVEGK